MKVISVDIETLSIKPNALVLSLGAVLINVDKAHGAVVTTTDYYNILSYHAQLATRIIDIATLEWWSKQEGEAQAVIEESKQRYPDTLRTDLSDFATWVNDIAEGEEIYFLAKDPDFDGVILESLFRQHNIDFPFKYNKRIALRTMAHAYELATGVPASYTAPELAHNAISDAQAQAIDYCDMVISLDLLSWEE